MIKKTSGLQSGKAGSEQMLQRTSGTGRLSTLYTDKQTRIGRLFQEGAAKLRLPRQAKAGMPLEAVMINTAGGLTGGDLLKWEMACASGGTLTLTTQACEKIYKSAGGEARVEVSLQVGENASLFWMPQETILFDQGRLQRRMDMQVSRGGNLLIAEAYLLGRKARGERVDIGHLEDRWRIFYEGNLVHREDLLLTGAINENISRKAVLSDNVAYATVLLLGDNVQDRLSALRDFQENSSHCVLGLSSWQLAGTGKILARIVASDGYELRKRLVPLMERLAGQVKVPKIWSL